MSNAENTASEVRDVIIVGSGPAGYTAAVYAAILWVMVRERTGLVGVEAGVLDALVRLGGASIAALATRAGLAPDDVDDRVLLVRAAPAVRGLEATVRRAVQEMEPGLPYVDVRQLADVLDPQIRPWRIGAVVFTAFGLLAAMSAGPALAQSNNPDFKLHNRGNVVINEADAITLTDVDTANGSISVNAAGAIIATNVAATGGNDRREHRHARAARARRHPARCRGRDNGTAARRVRGDLERRAADPAGRAPPHLRSPLHHQGRRRGDGAGPVHLPAHRPRARGMDGRAQRRGRHGVHRPPAGLPRTGLNLTPRSTPMRTFVRTLALLVLPAAALACGPSRAVAGGEDSASVPQTAIAAGAMEADARLAASPRHGEWAMVKLDGGADSVRAWVVYPERRDRAPVVVVVHEIFGVSNWIRAVADQLAADGFIAIAPDFLTGRNVPNGPDGQPLRHSATAAIRTLDQGQVQRRIDAVARYGMALPAALPKYGIVGFCWGGTASFNHAALSPAGLGASVGYNGSSPEAAQLASVKVPVLGLYGGNDARVNATIGRADSVLKASGKTFEQHVYEGAGHGFLRQQDGQNGANLAATRAAQLVDGAFALAIGLGNAVQAQDSHPRAAVRGR